MCIVYVHVKYAINIKVIIVIMEAIQIKTLDFQWCIDKPRELLPEAACTWQNN